jgi:hypothetical protein
VLFYGNIGGKKCSAEWGEHTNPEEYETVYIENEDPELEIHPGEEKRVLEGKDGFTTNVTRIVTYPDGTVERERTWTWRYRTQDEKIAVHQVHGHRRTDQLPGAAPVRRGYSVRRGVRSAGVGRLHDHQGLTSPVDSESKNGVVLSMSPGRRRVGVSGCDDHAEGRRLLRSPDDHHDDTADHHDDGTTRQKPADQS